MSIAAKFFTTQIRVIRRFFYLNGLLFSPGISFTPHETGTHLVNVYRDGQHIANSPFKINVTRNEVGNADKVKVYGDGLTNGMANEVNEFYVDTKDAGM